MDVDTGMGWDAMTGTGIFFIDRTETEAKQKIGSSLLACLARIACLATLLRASDRETGETRSDKNKNKTIDNRQKLGLEASDFLDLGRCVPRFQSPDGGQRNTVDGG